MDDVPHGTTVRDRIEKLKDLRRAQYRVRDARRARVEPARMLLRYLVRKFPE
jgi:hypothetical protein